MKFWSAFWLATTLCADTSYVHWHRLVGPSGLDTTYDYCANIPSTSNCIWGGPDAKEFTSFRNSGGIISSVTTRTEVKDGQPSISAAISHTSGGSYGEYIRVGASYEVHATIDFQNPILSQLFPNFDSIEIPMVALLLRDDGLIERGESIHLVKYSHWIYGRGVSVDFANLASGNALVDVSGGGGWEPAGIDSLHREDLVTFAFHHPLLLTNTSSAEAAFQVQLSTFYTGSTYGDSFINVDFGNTTAIQGIQMFGPNGEDLTAAFTFTLSDGTPLFTTSDVPEPASTCLVFTGLVLACLKLRSCKAAAS